MKIACHVLAYMAKKLNTKMVAYLQVFLYDDMPNTQKTVFHYLSVGTKGNNNKKDMDKHGAYHSVNEQAQKGCTVL